MMLLLLLLVAEGDDPPATRLLLSLLQLNDVSSPKKGLATVQLVVPTQALIRSDIIV
jgi:hypothetical protein